MSMVTYTSYYHQVPSPQNQAKKNSNKIPRDVVGSGIGVSGTSSEWDLLPPVSEVIESVDSFSRHYFQLSFISKNRFIFRLREDHRSVSPFLLLSILSISARLTPSLVRRFGSGPKASEAFIEHATQLSARKVYERPSLEACQAFYLLGIAQQRSGWKELSSMNMAISIRLAVLMELHRESAYAISNPSREQIVVAESARRTLWMLYDQDSLHSGPTSPASLVSDNIDTLLPCSEGDFDSGREPSHRAALEDLPQACGELKLTFDSGQSLFASLIQIRHIWGIIAKSAMNFERSLYPWDSQSEFSKRAAKLKWWEDGLPGEHLWNPSLLKGYGGVGQDTEAYLEVTMTTKLCNIVLRRSYLHDILFLDTGDKSRQNYFSDMSYQLFSHVQSLFEQGDARFTASGAEGDTGAQLGLFCMYVCGLFSAYLARYPDICPDAGLSRRGYGMLQRAISILAEGQETWPLATRWRIALEKLSTANGMPSPTLPPLTLPEAPQRLFLPGPPMAAPLLLPPQSQSQTAGLPRICVPPCPIPAPHMSPPSAECFGMSGQGRGEAGAGAALGPGNDGFEAELRFHLYGEESRPRVFG
ncbi:related to general repressor of transcription [Cephalotrichum gorgonifer]|uniref:Related to general repressor of transcription n=1 Tax=Cephalotrichum gorgonifer TaxID=2041049 RepID=A0AAE8MT52_9PEZI|nr:related to general repressor of transcription [Cephalotrichum gorgonifer]